MEKIYIRGSGYNKVIGKQLHIYDARKHFGLIIKNENVLLIDDDLRNVAIAIKNDVIGFRLNPKNFTLENLNNFLKSYNKCKLNKENWRSDARIKINAPFTLNGSRVSIIIFDLDRTIFGPWGAKSQEIKLFGDVVTNLNSLMYEKRRNRRFYIISSRNASLVVLKNNINLNQ